MSNESFETILAQEQGAIMRMAGKRKEFEAEFGIGEKEGTLVLTNKQLIFVCTHEIREDVVLNPFMGLKFLYSEVEDLKEVSKDPPNLFISLGDIITVKGRRGGLGRPSLEVEWNDHGSKRNYVFTEVLTGRRKRNLNDWAQIVENLKSGRQKLVALPPVPPVDTLEGKIMRVLADLQEKGVFTIEGSIEETFKVELGPDEVQATCDRLSSQGLLVRRPDSSGDIFYRRVSALGEDNPSS